jgi:hypothetical protein
MVRSPLFLVIRLGHQPPFLTLLTDEGLSVVAKKSRLKPKLQQTHRRGMKGSCDILLQLRQRKRATNRPKAMHPTLKPLNRESLLNHGSNIGRTELLLQLLMQVTESLNFLDQLMSTSLHELMHIPSGAKENQNEIRSLR